MVHLQELMQQLIINILVRSYNFSYAEAYKKWYRAQVTGSDQVIYDIMDGMIKDMNGLPVLINRNPTIGYGSILACKVMGINMDYTMSISLLVLPKLNADFDGDTLNILYLYNQDFIRLAFKTPTRILEAFIIPSDVSAMSEKGPLYPV